MNIPNRPPTKIGDSIGFIIPATNGKLDLTKNYDLTITLARTPSALCQCAVCNDGITDLHHLIPKAIGGTDANGRIYLCRKHHDILHHHLLVFLWESTGKQMPPDVQHSLRQHLKKKCQEWITARHNKLAGGA